jgi:diketogulonate reductase-like aldo/keto reductase
MSNSRRFDLDTLRRVAADAGKTPAQVALNWCLSRPNVITIPKTDRPERVDDLCGASGWSLTPDQLHALDQAFP